jgi:hypothetical protein
MRVRDKAFARQIIKQNDNALGMTCFDRSMAQTSKLGQIFSDVIPSSAPTENSKVFGASAYRTMGADQPLIRGITETVQDPSTKHASNFTSSLSSLFLGAGQFPFLNNLTSSLQSSLGSFTNSTSGFTNASNSFSNQWGQIQTLTTQMSGLFPSGILGLFGQVTSLTSSLSINTNALAGLGGFNNVINGVTNNSMTSAAGLDECSRLGKLWGNSSTLAGSIPGFKSVVGSGSESNTPYASFSQLLSGNVAGLDSSSGMAKELKNPANSSILQRAMSDFNGSGALSGAGNSPTWPSVPQITSTTATTTEIIGLMN